MVLGQVAYAVYLLGLTAALCYVATRFWRMTLREVSWRHHRDTDALRRVRQEIRAVRSLVAGLDKQTARIIKNIETEA